MNLLKSYRKKHWDRKRYCKRYGHTIKEETVRGLHIGKQMMVQRHTKFCTHCCKKLLWKDTPLEKKPQNYGTSFGSEGVCNHCVNYNDCMTAPKEKKDSYGMIMYPTYVYVYCPINNFKGTEDFYKTIKDDDTILIR